MDGTVQIKLEPSEKTDETGQVNLKSSEETNGKGQVKLEPDEETNETGQVRLESSEEETERVAPAATLKLPYTKQEDESILNYITKHQKYHETRGTLMWKEMAPLFPKRTWQSLKERFRRYIIPKMHMYKTPKEEKNKITTGFANSRK